LRILDRSVFRSGRAFPHEPIDLGIARMVRFGRRCYSTSVALATGLTYIAVKMLTESLTNCSELHALDVIQ
jgi:hypothetical protein